MSYQKRLIYLRDESNRRRMHEAIDALKCSEDRPIRMVLDEPEPVKSRLQEEKYHAMIGDIAKQFVHCGKKWSSDDMKRLLIDQFKRDTIKDPCIAPLWASMGFVEMAPALDGSGVVMMGAQSRKFPLKLAIIFIEWLYAFGSELEIKWSEP